MIRHRVLNTAAFALAVAAFVTTPTAASGAAAADNDQARRGQATRMNQVQVVATHNSYHRELPPAEQAAQRRYDPGANPNLFYSHASLTDQFTEQGVRSITQRGGVCFCM
ncbi:Ca2+-dependent phosphoinositide-specific phospholipase C [Actinomycetota bacterium]